MKGRDDRRLVNSWARSYAAGMGSPRSSAFETSRGLKHTEWRTNRVLTWQAWRMTLALVALGMTASIACGQSSADPSGEAYEQRRASQEVFRNVAAELRPSLVRIETVGGTQPRGSIPIGDNDAGSSEPRQQTPFTDTLGS